MLAAYARSPAYTQPAYTQGARLYARSVAAAACVHARIDALPTTRRQRAAVNNARPGSTRRRLDGGGGGGGGVSMSRTTRVVAV